MGMAREEREKKKAECMTKQNQRQRFLYAYAFNENRMNAKLNGDAEQRIGTTIPMNNVQRHTKEHTKCIYQNTLLLVCICIGLLYM